MDQRQLKHEKAAIELLSNSELVKLSFDIGEILEMQGDIKLIPLAMVINRELIKRRTNLNRN